MMRGAAGCTFAVLPDAVHVGGRVEFGQAVLLGLQKSDELRDGFFAYGNEVWADAGEGVAVFHDAEAGAGDFFGDRQGGLLEHVADVAPVGHDGIDAVFADPFAEELADLRDGGFVGEKEFGHAFFGGERGLFDEVASGVAVVGGEFIGAADGEADATVAEGAEALMGDANFLELIVGDVIGAREEEGGVDFDYGVLLPI